MILPFPMRLGISSYAYPWAIGVPGYPAPARRMTPLGLLDRAVALGVRTVQFADYMPLHDLSETQLDILRLQADERRLEIELGTSGIERVQLIRYLEIAVRLRAKLLRTVTDTATHRPSPSEAVHLLGSIVPELVRRGVTLALENHDRFTAPTLRRIVDDVGSPFVAICLDTANSLGCSEGPDLVLETLGPRTRCLHVKDYTIRRLPHRFGFIIEGAAAGRGNLDLPRWLTRLREMGSDVGVILEQWPSPEPTIEATIEKEAEWAQQSVAYLRQLVSD
jgi:sugar phosphate isomerase/epimerase